MLNDADEPVLDGTPDFIKSVPLDKALGYRSPREFIATYERP